MTEKRQCIELNLTYMTDSIGVELSFCKLHLARIDFGQKFVSSGQFFAVFEGIKTKERMKKGGILVDNSGTVANCMLLSWIYVDVLSILLSTLCSYHNQPLK